MIECDTRFLITASYYPRYHLRHPYSQHETYLPNRSARKYFLTHLQQQHVKIDTKYSHPPSSPSLNLSTRNVSVNLDPGPKPSLRTTSSLPFCPYCSPDIKDPPTDWLYATL